MVGVCNDGELKIELAPYNPMGGPRNAKSRPAFILTSANQPEGYAYFRKWFIDLFKDAGAAPEDYGAMQTPSIALDSQL
jgi:hypothetical protein